MHLGSACAASFMLLVLACPAGAGTMVAGQTTITLPDSARLSRPARRILDLEILRSAAIARHDTTWLARLYAPDFEGVAAGGRRVDRATLFRVFSGGDPESRFQIDELKVREFGASATVMGRLRGLSLAGDVIWESRYLHAYVKRGPDWWIVAAAGSAVPPAAAR